MYHLTSIDAYGEVIQTVSSQVVSSLEGGRHPDAWDVVASEPPSFSAYWSKDGMWVERPAQPSEFHAWDFVNKVWVDPRTLVDHQDAAWERIKLDRAAAATTAITVAGHTYDADPESRANIVGSFASAQDAIANGMPWQREWTLADDSSVWLTAEQMVQVGRALDAQVDAAHQRGRQLRAQIYATTDPHQLTNITWHAP